PAGALAEIRALHAGLRFVAAVHVDDRLLVEQVVHGETGLQVDTVDRQRPVHVGAEVVDPGHATKGAAPRIDQFARRPVTAVRLAKPARAAIAELVGEAASRTVVAGPDHAEGRDRTARTHAQGGTEGPHLV